MVITDRDMKIKEFIIEMGVCDTKTLSILFFNGSLRSCQSRMKKLTEINYVKCFRENIASQNIFYVNKKIINWKHKIVCSQLIACLKQNDVEILKARCPFKIDAVIVDMLLVVRIDDKVKIFYVEVERTKKLDVEKYLKLHYKRAYKNYFPYEPSILCITDRKMNTNNNVLEIIKCDTKFTNLINKIKE